MDEIYAETINSFAYDLNNLWKDKNKFKSAPLKNNGPVRNKEDDNCSLKRFLLSVNTPHVDSLKPKASTDSLTNIDRLAKSASIWTRPELSRIDADNILLKYEKGIFIVRMTSDKRTMVLSYRAEDKVQHVMIKVDLKSGFFMDGSSNIFRNVNTMISHYMNHSIQTPDTLLKLPRALREANCVKHFKFFENLKLDFWKTSLANKSISEIWPNEVQESRKAVTTDDSSDICPPLPPRGYDSNDLLIIQGLADIAESGEENFYNKIVKLKPKSETLENESIIYSEIWRWKSDQQLNVSRDQINERNSDNSSVNNFDSVKTTTTNLEFNEAPNIPNQNKRKSNTNTESILIKDIIQKYYPQLIDENFEIPKKTVMPSLAMDILKLKNINMDQISPKEEIYYEKIHQDPINQEDPVYQGHYEAPWDIQSPWITKLMDIDNYDETKQSEYMSEIIRSSSLYSDPNSKPIQPVVPENQGRDKERSIKKKKLSVISDTDDDDDDMDDDDNHLEYELLAEIQPVMFSPSVKLSYHNQKKSQYGQSIRKYLINVCSRRGTGDMSKYVKLFIQCTIDRADLSPYTTMRLIRQCMSGLKNLIKQQKTEQALINIIEEERKKTPKHVFINLDSIIESVLTKAVVKPLTAHLYRLLVLEHYKNHNLNLISDGVEVAKNMNPEKLGLASSAIPIINSKLSQIRNKLKSLSTQYSPERKIAHLISLIEIIFKMVKSIHPGTEQDVLKSDFKPNNLLPILVYIFSQCKTDAIALQCEVEYIEGLIWSSALVNGEPGYYLMNLMSSLEVIKVLARPQLSADDLIDLHDKDPTIVNNSLFYNQVSNPSSLAMATVGSVNVIILDEKINRLITKTFPVRSTVNVRNLCNIIAHRLGIFNPSEYSLYKYTGTEEVVLADYDFPLEIKQIHQQKTRENVNFLFKRNNATFILPFSIPLK